MACVLTPQTTTARSRGQVTASQKAGVRNASRASEVAGGFLVSRLQEPKRDPENETNSHHYFSDVLGPAPDDQGKR